MLPINPRGPRLSSDWPVMGMPPKSHKFQDHTLTITAVCPSIQLYKQVLCLSMKMHSKCIFTRKNLLICNTVFGTRARFSLFFLLGCGLEFSLLLFVSEVKGKIFYVSYSALKSN